LHYLDWLFDYVTRVWAVTLVKSASNEGAASGYIGTPGNAYSIITVGNIWNNNTQDWADDTIWSTSSYVNPESPHGDREKPEIAAPGHQTSSLGSSSTLKSIGGTSAATPHVTGIVALLQDRRWIFKYWPEPVKAILMAAAVHNIEGDARLSDYDGAGGVDGWRAYQIANAGDYRLGSLTTSSFDGSGNKSVTFSATAGQTVRVALTWDSTPNILWFQLNLLAADLDMYVYGPTGTFLAGSAGWDNAYEIVRFTAPSTGTYTIKIHNYRFDGSSEYYGLAWSKT